MSSFREMALRKAIPVLSKLYESFGVKAMILLQNNEWINVVTVIHLTRRKVEDLNNEYRLLEERLGKLDCYNFKALFQAKPISELQNIVSELEKGYLKVGELHTKLLARAPQTILDQKISQSGNVLQAGEYTEHDCYSVTLSMHDNPDNVLSKSGISSSILGLRDFDDLARSWLGLSTFGAAINIHFIIPIYAIVKEIQYQGGKEIKDTLIMDQRLFNDCTIWVTRKGSGDYAQILERKGYDVKSCGNVTQNGFVYIPLEHSFSALGPTDRISVTLLHNELGLIGRQEMSMVSFTAQTPDLFSQTFALFDAGKKMEEHLLNPKDDEDLVASVSWLLEMIGIRSLKLGRDECVRENKTEKGTADIIAWAAESNEVLVIDCTIGVPSGSKIDKIKNTADYISRKITFPVKAVIVTAAKSPAEKDNAVKYQVKILDNTDLEELIGFYKKGPGWHPKARIMLLET